jgi:uncharacterized protein involved in outer membrane biogenesis
MTRQGLDIFEAFVVMSFDSFDIDVKTLSNPLDFSPITNSDLAYSVKLWNNKNGLAEKLGV